MKRKPAKTINRPQYKALWERAKVDNDVERKMHQQEMEKLKQEYEQERKAVRELNQLMVKRYNSQLALHHTLTAYTRTLWTHYVTAEQE